jgi:aspartate kinase
MIVMKFGGTSVQDAAAIDRAAAIVRGRLPRNPVVVVSALAKVTDGLLAMGRAAGHGDRDGALDLSRQLRERHYNVASELLGTGVFTSFHGELEAEFDALDELLRGIAAVGEITPRTSDLVVSFGERLSSRIMQEALTARGVQAAHVDARDVIVTDNTHTRATPHFEETYDRLRRELKPLLDKKRVPVMGGFIAATREGVTTTIGRGGSDFSAAIIGAGLAVESIEIWTDVDGMMTTDPNLVREARRIKVISFEEAAELAYFGAKVLHPATLLPAIQLNIPVYVLNSRNPKCEGTRVQAAAPACRNVFKAIAVKKRITLIDVAAARSLSLQGFLKTIFETFDRHNLVVDAVSISGVSVSLTVDATDGIPALAADLGKLADVKYEGRKALVCLVGENIRQTPGIVARVFGALGDIKVRMISQGASEINLTFVVEEEQMPEVVATLHREFFSDLDPDVFA